MEAKGFFQFKMVIIKCLKLALSASFEYLCHGLVYGYEEYFYIYSAGIDYRRQGLTSIEQYTNLIGDICKC